MYATWKSSNSSQDLSGKYVLVIGGTQGIGAGVARRFSQLGASVAIAGRNETKANEVIELLKKDSKNFKQQEFRFFKVDASLLKDLSRFTDETRKYYESKGGLDHLVQSQGGLGAIYNPVYTSEGMDQNFVATSYSKWVITTKLMPLLKESCMYILAPSFKGVIDFNDVECRNKSSSQRFISTHVFVDSITKEFQKRNEKVRFYHIFPGVVDTEIFKNAGFYSWFNNIMAWFLPWVGRSPIDFADLPVYVATHPSELNGGVRLSENMKEYSEYDWMKSDENRSKLFQWCEQQQLKILK